MKNVLFFTTALLFLSPVADAQTWNVMRYEITAGIGTTQLYGDIGGFPKGKNLLGIKDFTFHNTRLNLSTGVRYRLSDDFSARLNLAFGFLHTTDVRGINENRGFESRTTFFEPSLIIF